MKTSILRALSIAALSFAALVNGKPHFLWSGQSNSIGHTTDGQSLEGAGTTLFEDLVAILNDDVNGDGQDEKEAERLRRNLATRKQKERKLRQRIEQAHVKEHYQTKERSAWEAQELLELHSRGLIQNIKAPLMNAQCSFNDPSQEIPGPRLDPINVSPYAKCGGNFGHELMFSHALSSKADWSNQPFTVDKVAVGGTKLYESWFPGVGTYWDALNSTIHTKSVQEGAEWKAFVWHQGSQECWEDEDTSVYYQTNLTELVAVVRQEMFLASPGNFASASDIPVVIVELGTWPKSCGTPDRKPVIVNAQNAVVNNDPNAVLVKTDDLSVFYHYDCASLLVMGDRICQALEPMLETP